MCGPAGIVEAMPGLWAEAQEQHLLKGVVLVTVTRLVQALGSQVTPLAQARRPALATWRPQGVVCTCMFGALDCTLDHLEAQRRQHPLPLCSACGGRAIPTCTVHLHVVYTYM
jgi:hypothetical protein